MIVYRLSKGKYKDDISGTGAEIYGGRWNNKGRKMLYTASSRALAMAEVAVHVPLGKIPKNYFLISIEIPDVAIARLNPDLGKTKKFPSMEISQRMGDNFLKSNNKLILMAPSKVVPGDYNYLLNPLHKDFTKVKIVAIEAFEFDSRLFF